MLIGKVLSQRALITPDREALIFKDTTFTYRQLNGRAVRLANAMLEFGVSTGERVGLLMNNCNEFIEVYFATVKIGAVLVPLNTRLVGEELDFILKDCGVSVFFYGPGFEEKVGDIAHMGSLRHCVSTCRPLSGGALDYEDLIDGASDQEPSVPIQEDDLHVIMYTSGTTGRPKGAMLSHANMYSAALDLQIGLHYQYPDRCLLLAPFFHSGAISPFVGHVIRGICTVIMETFDPAGALRLIENTCSRLLIGVTTIMKMLLREPDLDAYDLGSWEMAILPGSPLPYSLIEEAHRRLDVLCQNLWGLTEICGPGALMNVEDILRYPESAGKPYFNVDIRIVDTQDRDVPPGQGGEILVRGRNMMLGYWNRPEETERTIRDGWLYTGDLGRFDDDGYLYVIDRIKDMIISGGENVYPVEIEKVLLEIPEVDDVAVIGVPDEKWGETPKAFVVVYGGASLSSEAIVRHCRSKLAGYKVPKHVEFIDQIPRNPSGKALRKELRLLPS
ncbi:MAG: long-chain-fatty-acid--CoA ligase [Desulfobacterales bacterium]|nr:long-chain-fatty-acid--CoA ligase [Desulfobacterales bacterium]